MKKLTKDYIEKESLKYNKEVKVASDYKDSRTPIVFICKCGNQFQKTWTHFKEKPMCKQCGYKDGAKQRTFSIEKIKELSSDKGIKILSEKYENSYTRLRVRCEECENEWETNFAYIQENKVNGGCPNCMVKIRSKSKTYGMKYITEKLKDINKNLLIIDKNYISSKTKMNVFCKKCNNIFKTDWNHLNAGRGCPNCAIKKRKGEGNGNYNPMLSNKDRMRRRLYYKGNSLSNLRNEVYKRDDYTCKVCSNRGGKLNAHHLDGYHWYIEGRYDPNNCITLCESCHKEFHKTYGNRNNTREQFEEYLKHAQ